MNNEIETQSLDDVIGVIPVDTESASTNFYWTFGKHEVFNLQTTLRGTLNPDQIAAHLKTSIEGMKQVLANGGHAKPVGYQNRESSPLIPNPATPAQAATETGKESPHPKPVSTQSAPYETPHITHQTEGPGKKVLELIASKVEIVPAADGKAQLKFYETGHKYPDLYSTKPVSTWSGILGWDVDEFSSVKTFDNLKLVIGYTLSEKLNSKNNPYKDIAYIK